MVINPTHPMTTNTTQPSPGAMSAAREIRLDPDTDRDLAIVLENGTRTEHKIAALRRFLASHTARPDADELVKALEEYLVVLNEESERLTLEHIFQPSEELPKAHSKFREQNMVKVKRITTLLAHLRTRCKLTHELVKALEELRQNAKPFSGTSHFMDNYPYQFAKHLDRAIANADDALTHHRAQNGGGL